MPALDPPATVPAAPDVDPKAAHARADRRDILLVLFM
jgi:hypothetical protein